MCHSTRSQARSSIEEVNRIGMFRFRPIQRVFSGFGRLGQTRTCSHQNAPSAFCAELNAENAKVHFHWRPNGSLRVQLNNLAKRNAMNLVMYQSIGRALRFASDSEQVKCVIFEGKDGCYSSGNDLSNFWIFLLLETLKSL